MQELSCCPLQLEGVGDGSTVSAVLCSVFGWAVPCGLSELKILVMFSELLVEIFQCTFRSLRCCITLNVDTVHQELLLTILSDPHCNAQVALGSAPGSVCLCYTALIAGLELTRLGVLQLYVSPSSANTRMAFWSCGRNPEYRTVVIGHSCQPAIRTS